MKLTEADKKGIILAVMCMLLIIVSVGIGKAFETTKSEPAESPTVYTPEGIKESIVLRVFRGGHGQVFHSKILLENGKIFVNTNKADGYAFRGTPEERAFFFAEKGDTIYYSNRIVKIAFKQD